MQILKQTKKSMFCDIIHNQILQLLGSKNKGDHDKGMCIILKQILKSVDMSKYYLNVIKISDTVDTNLKRKINYYLSHYGNDPNLLVLTVNTLLKDLNDSNKELRILAIDFIGKINYLDEYFLRGFILILKNGESDERKKVLKNITKFFGNPEWVQKYKLVEKIRENVYEIDNFEALNVTYKVWDQYKVISHEQIFELFGLKGMSNESEIIVLMILEKHIDDILKNCPKYAQIFLKKCENLLESFLNGTNLEKCYLAAKMLLKIDTIHSQAVFNQILKFSKTKRLHVKFLFEFIRDMIKNQDKFDFEFSNSELTIFENDTVEIKVMKLDMMLCNFDDFSIQELDKCCKDYDLYHECLFLKLKLNLPDRILLEKCLEKNPTLTINFIYDMLSNLSTNWEDIIIEEFYKVNISDGFKNKFIYIVGKTIKHKKDYEKYLDILFKKEKANDYDEIISIQFYINLYIRKIIEKEIFLNYLKNTMLGKTVIKLIESDKDVDYRLSIFGNHKNKKLQDMKTLEPISSRFICAENYNLYSIKDTFNNKIQDKMMSSGMELNVLNEKNASTGEKVIFEWEANDFCLKIVYMNDYIFLKIIRIECELNLSICPYLNKKIITEKSEFMLFQCTEKFFKRKIEICVNHAMKNVEIGLIDLIVPYNCTSLHFNDKFGSIKVYEIVNEKDLFDSSLDINPEKIVYFIDMNLFAFNLLGNVFYGMIMSGQVVLKCENRSLFKNFLKEICSRSQ